MVMVRETIEETLAKYALAIFELGEGRAASCTLAISEKNRTLGFYAKLCTNRISKKPSARPMHMHGMKGTRLAFVDNTCPSSLKCSSSLWPLHWAPFQSSTSSLNSKASSHKVSGICNFAPPSANVCLKSAHAIDTLHAHVLCAEKPFHIREFLEVQFLLLGAN